MKELRVMVIVSDGGDGGSLTSSSPLTITITQSSYLNPTFINSSHCPSSVIIKENSMVSFTAFFRLICRNIQMNQVVGRCRAFTLNDAPISYKWAFDIPVIPPFSYRLSVMSTPLDERSSAKFRLFTRDVGGEEWIELSVMETLDYETTTKYTVTITATVRLKRLFVRWWVFSGHALPSLCHSCNICAHWRWEWQCASLHTWPIHRNSWRRPEYWKVSVIFY